MTRTCADQQISIAVGVYLWVDIDNPFRTILETYSRYLNSAHCSIMRSNCNNIADRFVVYIVSSHSKRRKFCDEEENKSERKNNCKVLSFFSAIVRNRLQVNSLLQNSVLELAGKKWNLPQYWTRWAKSVIASAGKNLFLVARMQSVK